MFNRLEIVETRASIERSEVLADFELAMRRMLDHERDQNDTIIGLREEIARLKDAIAAERLRNG